MLNILILERIIKHLLLCLLIFIFLTNNSFAQEIEQILEDRLNNGTLDDNDTIITNLKKNQKLIKDTFIENNIYTYLLLSTGFNSSSITDSITSGSNVTTDFIGALVHLTAGIQIQHLAIESALGYKGGSHDVLNLGLHKVSLDSFDIKSTILYQHQIMLNKSWTIVPKIGAGIYTSFTTTDVITYLGKELSYTGYGFLTTIGIKAIYKNLIFGISGDIRYGWLAFNPIAQGYYTASLPSFSLDEFSFQLLAEVGVKF